MHAHAQKLGPVCILAREKASSYSLTHCLIISGEISQWTLSSFFLLDSQSGNYSKSLITPSVLILQMCIGPHLGFTLEVGTRSYF